MENKYYVPELEDLYSGYQCEIWWNYNYLPENEWCEIRVFEGSTEEFDQIDFSARIDKNQIRTKFLDRDDIESLGWKFDIDARGMSIYELNEKYILSHDMLNNRIRIEEIVGCVIFLIIEAIECKSINELKKVMKWIGINLK